MILDHLHANGGPSVELAAAQFVYHSLAAENARRRQFEGVDVERFVAAVNLLGGRREHPIAPFVDAWRGGVEDVESTLEGVQQSAGRFVSAVAAQSGQDPNRYRGHVDSEQIGAQLIDVIQSVTGQRRSRSVFHGLDWRLRQSLFRLLDIPDPAVTSYLSPLVRTAHDHEWSIATLNYDLAVESCATGQLIEVTVGVESWATEEQLVFRDDALTLLKLHGSIGWSMARQPRPGALATTLVDVFTGMSASPGSDQPAIIFGEGNKLSAAGPFLDLFMEFSRRLSQATTLVIVGYSMRDDHVNEVIARWMNRDSAHRLIWLDPTLPVDEPGGIRTRSYDPRQPFRNELINLHDNSAPERILMISATARDGIASAIEQALG